MGNTTGWMTGAAQSEFLRRVSMRGCDTCRLGWHMCPDLLCLGTESTSRSRRTTTCLSGERSMRASCLRNVAHSQPCALARDSVHQDQYREDARPMLRQHRALCAELRGARVRASGPVGVRRQRADCCPVCVCVRALLAQCWAFRSLTIELNGSAVHAQFPDWPANEAVPIVELMQLPIQTNGWVSRGVNSSLVNVSVSTDGVRTNCACGACAPRKCCALCTYGGSDAACLFSLPHSHAPTGRRPRADCDVLERRGVA